MDHEMKEMNRAYSNSFLDMLGRYSAVPDKPVLSIQDLDELDRHHG